jgi:predicted nucleotidyltransferase
MASAIRNLTDKGIAHPPKFLPDNTHYETIMGSFAYGVSSDTSDMDVYGFCIPPKEDIFPHLRGEIIGFGNQKQRFNQYQEHHLVDPDSLGGRGRVYDISIYNIVDYFQLVMKNNPNMIDSLFTNTTCLLHCSQIGHMVRDKRKIFLHKGSWHTFKGYAYSQVCKISGHERTGKRKEVVEEFGYDVKFAYHVVRLLNEIEMILSEGDLDLMRNNEQLKSIRRGEWKEQEIRDYFTKKESELETLYQSSKLPWGPDEGPIKKLLLECLEHHYGSIGKCVVDVAAAEVALNEISEIIHKWNKKC